MTSLQLCWMLGLAGALLMFLIGIGALWDGNEHPGRASVALLVGLVGVGSLLIRVLLLGGAR